ncbi:MAG: SRPBCC family protein [Chromatiales bacterium]|nr:SRPBCC family protein [Chromatiales bacterium]
MRCFIISLLALLLTPAAAAELLSMDVSKDGERVFVAADVAVEATPDEVYAALIDYNNFSGWSQRYRDTSYIDPAADGRPQVSSNIQGCILFFCRNVSRVVVLDLEPPHYIRATASPDLSDVRYGVEQWWIEVADKGSVVRYTHELEFDFWMPPVIGVWAIRRSLQRDALKAAERIELMAN